jgi:ubiquinone/menaquinone biosynthesis C-methylase UbiE
MKKEISFNKYKTRGADYHYKQIEKYNFKEFNSFVYARYQKQVDLLENILRNRKSKKNNLKILDVGCGDGVLINLIRKKTKHKLEYFGVDLSEEALNIAKNKNPEAEFKKTDVYNLKYKKNYFDFVISSDVIEHVKDQRGMLLEIRRVLKKEGVAIIGTPVKITEKPLDKMHFYEFFPKEFENLANDAFGSAKLILSHSLFYYLLMKKRVFLFKKGFSLFKYLISLASFFGLNPFLKKIKEDEDFPVYMFIICKK